MQPRAKPPPKHSKEAVLQEWLSFFRTWWELNRIHTTLTDKDWSEIAALSLVFPEARIQLCFWHAVRAVKTRLAILRHTPAPYDAKKASEEFPFIDQTFVPRSQLTETQVRIPSRPASNVN